GARAWGRGRTSRIASRHRVRSSSSRWRFTQPRAGDVEYTGAPSTPPMKILISNDDGYRSEGIRLLREYLSDLGEVTMVAPDRNRSGASNSLTLDVPLRVYESEPGVYFVGGTPTDCVHLAIS